MVLIAMAWLPVIENARGLYYYLQAVQSYFFPPMFVVFFFGVFSKRLNGKGCVAAMVVGFILGIFRMAVDTPVTLGGFGYENGVAIGYPAHSFLWIVNNIYFQYFSLLIAFVSAAAMVGVSYLTEPPDYERIKGLTIGTASAEDSRITRESWDWRDVLASGFILLCILGAYLYFIG
jgi:SSS family solute:Na+ symporter